MLKDNFYTIIQTTRQDAGISFSLKLNEDHPIYSGHFPGQPVVPGACLLQVVIELMEAIFEKELKFVKADELKFLLPINPLEDNMLRADISYVTDDTEKINVTAVFFQKPSSPCFKCKAVFTMPGPA